ncbi:hypothetical protein [Nonomuraea turkmeniaca]|uniref:hypothetical protein n=1 Tax=Nonomuraea turkmeniaca TaxID=103838 RepID=UPI001476814C|nr:hypothetical protein [Nonomuraea turkmeniaca]
MKTPAPDTTRTPAEIQAATDEVYSRMVHQPKRRGFLDGPCVEKRGCTCASCVKEPRR